MCVCIYIYIYIYTRNNLKHNQYQYHNNNNNILVMIIVIGGAAGMASEQQANHETLRPIVSIETFCNGETLQTTRANINILGRLLYNTR